MTNLLMIFVGGGLGSICRYGVSKWLTVDEVTFPYGTLVANALSSLVLGFMVGLVLFSKISLPNEVKMLIMVGFCGGFSTYSTFTNDTFQLIQSGNWSLTLLNIFGNLAVCLLTLMGGIALSKYFF